MMTGTSLSHPLIRRFAFAFYDSIRGERLDPILAEYRMILELMEAYPDLGLVLDHRVLADEAKEKLLTRVLETCSVSKELSGFLKTLVRRGRMDWLRPIYDAMHRLKNRDENREVAWVRTAFRLNELKRERLKKRLEVLAGKQIELRIEEDPALIGGVSARVGDRIFDSSIHRRLALIEAGMTARDGEDR